MLNYRDKAIAISLLELNLWDGANLLLSHPRKTRLMPITRVRSMAGYTCLLISALAAHAQSQRAQETPTSNKGKPPDFIMSCLRMLNYYDKAITISL
jgi:hypothetical protein